MSPTSARIRMYKMGFGDCFLVSFMYPGPRKVHMLIDFGTTKTPGGSASHMVNVANDIRKETEGHLHIVVATHRHKDHISGFATTTQGDGPGDIIRSLHPDVVLMPWTEDPDAEEDAAKPTKTRSGHALRRQLDHMHIVAAGALRFSANAGLPDALRRRLAFLGEDNIKNVSAVRNLQSMGKECRYLYFGADPELGKLLPGVSVRVLGPPTLEQSEAIRSQRVTDHSQFWMLTAAAVSSNVVCTNKPLFSRRYVRQDDGISEDVRWLTDRLARTEAEQMLGIVTVLDNAMNNTSLILLLDVGGRKLLFPGDAQIENWEYALSHPKIVAELKDVAVYKVGHHGSRNATPLDLWNRFAKRSADPGRPDRLKTLLSTEAGKHGREETHTEVPRETLVEALKEDSDFHTTEAVGTGVDTAAFEDIVIPF